MPNNFDSVGGLRQGGNKKILSFLTLFIGCEISLIRRFWDELGTSDET